MKKNLRHLVLASLLILAISMATSPAQADTPIDGYKSMGAVAALAEACYGSEQIPQRLEPVIKAQAEKQPNARDILKTLVSVYNAAYKKAVLDRKIWNGTAQAYGPARSCSKPDDVALIRHLEGMILSLLSKDGQVASTQADGAPASAASAQPTSPDEAEQSRAAPSISVGDAFRAGTVEVTIISAETRDGVGTALDNSTPSDGGIYVAIRWKYKNISRKPVDAFDTPSIHLIAPDGTKYDTDAGASSSFADEVGTDAKIVSDLNPGITVNDADVFEVSKQMFDPSTWKILVEINDQEIPIVFAAPSKQTQEAGAGRSQESLAPGSSEAPTSQGDIAGENEGAGKPAESTPTTPNSQGSGQPAAVLGSADTTVAASEAGGVPVHPSFNCARAASLVEHAICASPALSRLDKQLALAYRAKLAASTPDAEAAITKAQRQWVKARNACATAHCLTSAYQQRISELQSATGTQRVVQAAEVQDASSVASAGEGAQTVAVSGRSNPWDQSANPSMQYSQDAFPPVVWNLAQHGVTAGSAITIRCVGGTTNAGGIPDTGCDGVKGMFPPNNASFQPACGEYYPSKYEDPSMYPTWVFQVMGVFATADGAVVGKPFPVSSSAITVKVPAQATQLQFGMNDCRNSDNSPNPLMIQLSFDPAR